MNQVDSFPHVAYRASVLPTVGLEKPMMLASGGGVVAALLTLATLGWLFSLAIIVATGLVLGLLFEYAVALRCDTQPLLYRRSGAAPPT